MEPLKFVFRTIKSYKKILDFLVTNDSRFSFVFRSLEANYEFLNKKRVSLKLKEAETQLEASSSIRVGSLLQTKGELSARPEYLNNRLKTDWIVIPSGATLVFLGVKHDPDFDTVTLRVLWESQIFFIHKNADFKDFNKLGDKFKVLI